MAKESLEYTTLDMKKFYDQKTRPTTDYQKCDLILLEGTNIISNHPSKSVVINDMILLRLEKVENFFYHLNLYPRWKGIHNVSNDGLDQVSTGNLVLSQCV